ncbi:hypothetical protein [Streptomyces sp. NPDC057623]|uniref:hypothetical protein n=1 Tax=Streptomyces sp. NPDC057623 TaxID=3346187 RepID=UPI003679572C
MISLLRRSLRKRSGVVFAAVAALVMLGAAPASANSFDGSYYNSLNGGKYEGYYSWSDGNNAVTVSNIGNGYHVRVRVQAYVSGAYYSYLDKYSNDNTTLKSSVPDAMPKVKMRISLCYYSSDWNYLGGCNYHYGYNT